MHDERTSFVSNSIALYRKRSEWCWSYANEAGICGSTLRMDH